MNTREIFKNMSEKPAQITEYTLAEVVFEKFPTKVQRGFFQDKEVAVRKKEVCIDEDIEDIEKELINHYKISRLGHASHYVVTLFGYQLHDTGYSIVVSYAAYGSLNDFLNIPLDFAIKEKIIIDIAVAIAWLHSHRMLHRDLSSKNIVIGADLTPYLCDFEHAIPFSKLSKAQEKMLIGTPIFMAPEVIESRRYSRKSDMYSFAVICCQIMSQCEPYANDNSSYFDIFRKVVNGLRPEINPEWHPKIVSWLRLGLSGDPRERPSAKLLLQWLAPDREIVGEKPAVIDDAIVPYPIEECTCRVM